MDLAIVLNLQWLRPLDRPEPIKAKTPRSAKPPPTLDNFRGDVGAALFGRLSLAQREQQCYSLGSGRLVGHIRLLLCVDGVDGS